MNGLDRELLLAMRSRGDLTDPAGPDWLLRAAIDFTSLGGHTVLATVVLIATTHLMLARRRYAGGVLAVSALGAMAMNHALKLLFARPRPDLVEHLVGVVTPSMPSGHALLSTAIYFTLAGLVGDTNSRTAVRRYLLIVAACLSGLIGLSRIYLGVHWPSDVLAGWAVGGLWAYGTLRIARCLRATRP